MIELTHKGQVGILTFTYGDNFGQRLQNLAVQELINSYGYKAFTIPQVVPDYYCLQNEKRHNHFKEFDEQFINYYSDSIGKNKLPKGIEDFEYFVTGSDQVWSPYSPDVNSSFFLTFAPREKRVAFAPSIAANNIPLRKKLAYRKYFKGFDKISVREEKSAELVRKISSKPVYTLIDPTLMFDFEFWDKYLKRPNYSVPQNYILYYGLGNTNEEQRIKEIATTMECDIITLREGEDKFNIGPAEFIYLIKNANGVVTDSYHGIIFSIIYHRPFIYIERNQNGLDMSSRFDTLFSKLKIPNKSINRINKKNMEELDYDAICENIANERKMVRDFLAEYFAT